MTEQYKVSIPIKDRVSGWLYDYHSGLCMGIASDELRKKQPAGIVFDQHISGCPHQLVIHP